MADERKNLASHLPGTPEIWDAPPQSESAVQKAKRINNALHKRLPVDKSDMEWFGIFKSVTIRQRKVSFNFDMEDNQMNFGNGNEEGGDSGAELAGIALLAEHRVKVYNILEAEMADNRLHFRQSVKDNYENNLAHRKEDRETLLGVIKELRQAVKDLNDSNKALASTNAELAKAQAEPSLMSALLQKKQMAAVLSFFDEMLGPVEKDQRPPLLDFIMAELKPYIPDLIQKFGLKKTSSPFGGLPTKKEGSSG